MRSRSEVKGSLHGRASTRRPVTTSDRDLSIQAPEKPQAVPNRDFSSGVLGLAVRRMHLTMRPDSALRTRDGRIVDDAIAIHREIDHAIGRLKEVR